MTSVPECYILGSRKGDTKMTKTNTNTNKTVDLVVTRHPALVEYLRERGLVDETTPVVSHVTDPSEIEGKVVAGVLPLHLAAACYAVVEIPLALAPEDRGRELSIERLREIAGEPRVFSVAGITKGELTRGALRELTFEAAWWAEGRAARAALDLFESADRG